VRHCVVGTAGYTGLIKAFATIRGLPMIGSTTFFGDPVAGYPPPLVAVLLARGAQPLSSGVIGEYLGRVFNEAKQRLAYLVDSDVPGGASPAIDEETASIPCGEGVSTALPRKTDAVQE
jgi:hypothetical protein